MCGKDGYRIFTWLRTASNVFLKSFEQESWTSLMPPVGTVYATLPLHTHSALWASFSLCLGQWSSGQVSAQVRDHSREIHSPWHGIFTWHVMHLFCICRWHVLSENAYFMTTNTASFVCFYIPGALKIPDL